MVEIRRVLSDGGNMANEKQRRAFISYSRINKEFATKLVKGLRSAGYPVWFDLLDIPTGSRWDDEVEKALRECSIFMIILTPASIASENVKDEIGYAIDHGKRILPVLLEECDVPLRLRRFQYVDFTTKSFEEGFESAKELLKSLIDEVSVPIPTNTPLVEAPIESKPEPVKVKPVPAMTVRKTEVGSTDVTQKKPIPMGLMIGIVAVVVLVIAGIGFSAFSNKDSNTPVTEAPIVNPITEAPVVKPPTETPVVADTPTVAPVAKAFNFQACPEQCTGQNSSTTFESGVKAIYVQFDYQDFRLGSQYTREWTNDGDHWIKYSCAWDGSSSGTEKITLSEPNGLRFGTWEMIVTFDSVVLLSEKIKLTGNFDFWSPVPNTINKCRKG